MPLPKYRFRPRLLPTLATLALLPLMLWLGFWQLDRAQQKRALQMDYDARIAAQAVSLVDAVVATENVGHLGLFTEARPWATIKP
mgnify:CR=1 FL=1